jgi:signal transduction histidine kinase
VSETAPVPSRGGASVTEQALAAQEGLLPYALAAFGVTLPMYVWVGGHAADAPWMSCTFISFGLAWGALYGVVNWLKTPEAADLRRRGRVHLYCGLMWAAAVAQIAVFADRAGPVRETLLEAALAAGMICTFFASVWLPSLLVVAPVAVAGPLIAFFARPESRGAGQVAWGATAMALALGLLVNQILRRQFALAAEREGLVAESAQQAAIATRLARSKSDLVSALSSEVRNGLTGVAHVLAAAAGRGGRAAPSREQLNAALDATGDLLDVVATTLDAETAQAGRLTVDLHPLDAVGLARGLVQRARPRAAAKGLEVALVVDPELSARTTGAVLGDPARVRQALAALVSNAVKYSLRGRVEVRIGLAGPDRLSIAVADTGPGLSDAEMALAFEPFQRIARTCAGAPGAGLGLTLARDLARLMGGAVTGESAPGVGSCFVLQLPWREDLVAEPLEGPADAGLERVALKVLLAETDALAAAQLRAQLEQLGHQVLQAADGARAVELARNLQLDLVMAGSGSEAQALLTQVRDLPRVAVIGGDPDEARDAIAAGASAILRKPFGLPALARALADAQSAERQAA